MSASTRRAGLAALAFTVTTFAAVALTGTPGGDYEPSQVASYISSGHHVPAFIGGYLGLAGALALIVLTASLRRQLPVTAPAAGDAVWGLGVAAAATAVVGWSLAAGIPVAYAEGGQAGHQLAVSSSTIYVLGEVASLASFAVPAILVGAALLIVAARLDTLPAWLRRTTYVAGVCGIAAPFFFPYFLFLLWGIVFGIRQVVDSRSPAAEPALA
jgi:hypothetical protein